MATTAMTDPVPSEKKGLPIVKIVVGVLILAGIIVLFRVLPVADWLKQFQAYVKDLGAVGYVVYALVYALCCILFVPASVLTLGAGAIFGLVAGTIVVVLGATLGATLSFLLARTVMRKKIEGMTSGNAKFQALDKAIAKEGAKIVFLIRLSPVFPFTYINYGFGLTGVKTVPYILATLFGIIPGTFAFVYIGNAAAGAAAGGASHAKTIINIVGAIATLLVTIVVAKVAANAIKKAGVDETPAATPPAATQTP
ncbi:MAG TPA: TVP38/TMEM64 family protein [Thermoanaerobaculia bacterium]|nr:TVP38/TMEM64 family protein [Thermoanaerobaculia bacterium]